MTSPHKTGGRMRRAPAMLAAGTLIAAGLSGPVTAQTHDEMVARLAELEAMVAQLRADIDARDDARADAPAPVQTVARAAPAVAPAPRRSLPAADIEIGDTRIDIGGFVDFDAHVTSLSDGTIASRSMARDLYVPGATPIGGGRGQDEVTDFTAESSRIFMASETATAHGPLGARLEVDFLGSPSGDERVSNSYAPRLRRAELTHRGWLAGQSWSTFMNLSAIPDSASFLPAGDGMIFVRQAQLRVTRGGWTAALENPQTTLTPFAGGARIDADESAIPDAIVRYDRSGHFGAISVAALGRELSHDDGVHSSSTFGWAVSMAGRLTVGEGDVRFMATGGEGVGRYIGLNSTNAGVLDAEGDIHPIASLGGLVAYRHPLGERFHVNLGVSGLFADNPVSLTGVSATRRTSSGFVALMSDLAPGLSVGAELLVGERELESGQSGSLSRFTLSTRRSF